MKYKDLESDALVLEWFASLSPGKETQRNYLFSLQAYTELIKLTPSELIDEADADTATGILPRKRRIRSHLLDFKEHLISKGLADFTIKNRLTGVRSFYSAFDIELPKLLSEKRRAVTIKENDEIPTKSDIQDVLRIADPLEKAIILTGAASGLAANEIRNLKLSDFEKGYDPKTEICTLDLRRLKARVDFITFLTPEATRSIRAYLEFRGRESKSPTADRKIQLDKQAVTPGSYLFILRQVPDEYLETRDEELRKISLNALNKMFASLSDRARKNTKNGTYNIIRSHTMRKVFSTTIQNAGAPYLFKEQCLGHKISNTDKAYSKPSVDANLEMYRKYIPYLTIEKNLDVSTSPDYMAAIKRAEKAEAEAVRVSIERNEIMQLKAEIERIDNAAKERKALEAQFADVMEERKRQVKEIEEKTGLDYDEALHTYDIGRMLPDSKILEAHGKRLKTDATYRATYRAAISQNKAVEFEKSRKEENEKIIERINNLKFLSDDL